MSTNTPATLRSSLTVSCPQLLKASFPSEGTKLSMRRTPHLLVDGYSWCPCSYNTLPPCGPATEPPSEGLGRVGQLEDKGLTGSLPSGAAQCHRRDVSSIHAIAAMTEQQEKQRTACLPWGFGISCQGDCSLLSQLPLLLEIGSCQKTNKQTAEAGGG